MCLLQAAKRKIETDDGDLPLRKKLSLPAKQEKNMRINVGWRHKYDEGKGAVLVRDSEGGGSRFVRVLPTATVAVLKAEAMKVFLNNKKAKQWVPSHTSSCIETSDEFSISEFTDPEGNACDLKTYLFSRGLYASKTNSTCSQMRPTMAV